MEPSGREGTDGSSIKPVSSLRSHFETMGSIKPPPPTGPKPALRTQHLNIKQDADTSGRAEGRMSLDLPRPSFVEASNGIPKSRTPEPSKLASDQSKSRPLSMGPFSPPVEATTTLTVPPPPAVTVISPKSPPRFGDLVQPMTIPLYANSSTPSKPAKPNAPLANGSGHNSASSVNRPRNQSLHGRTSPFEDPDDEPGTAPAATKKEAIPSHPKPPLPAPPPVNRAGKPKAMGPALIVPTNISGRTSLSPVINPSSAADDKVSPFSTPPSSGEESQKNSPPPLNLAMKPNAAPPKPKTPPKSKTPTPDLPSKQNAPARTIIPPPSSSHAPIGSGQDPRKRSPQPPALSRMSVEEEEEPPPFLPPRRDKANVESRPVQIAKLRESSSRSSLDNQRRVVSAATEATARFAPPPKRANTTATRQAPQSDQASNAKDMPRALGRIDSDPIGSDRSSSRTGYEKHRRDDREEDLDLSENAISTGASSVTEFPDASRINRRPPRSLQKPYELGTGYDTKLLAVCGEYICTTGFITRVWSASTGEQLLAMTHQETMKCTAVAFKPSTTGSETRLWLGTNSGEIHEIDIPSEEVIYTRPNAHSRREVLRIYRHASEMWSLDDDGRLHVWPPDKNGTPSLQHAPVSYKVPKGHTFSLVVGNQLWVATGKDIRVYRPSSDPSADFQVLPQALGQGNVGEVTSGTTLSSEPDKVYFGHNDGKISIYSRKDYSHLGTVNVSLYKINSLVGVGQYLWAGYKTGMIYVYDTRSNPWVVKKDWTAHEEPVASIVADPSGIWKLDRLQVVSLGTDQMIKLWDGMLKNDWLEEEMQQHDAEFCVFREITCRVLTWNAGAAKPTNLRHDQQDNNFFRDYLSDGQDSPDILVFGFQELVDLEDKKVTARNFFKSRKKDPDNENMSHQYRAWRDHLTRCIETYMPDGERYILLHTASLVGLFTCVFVKQTLKSSVRDVRAAEVKRGMGGHYGNKGALILRFLVDDSSLCFINCHLAAGQTHTANRNNDIAGILEEAALPSHPDQERSRELFVGGGDGSMVLDHEICILNGDLNYRIDSMPRDAVVKAVQEDNLAKLLDRDQLLLSRRRNPGFRLRSFHEGQIDFAPTYKYDVGTDRYDTSEKKRAPAWCDRLLYRGLGRIKQTEYCRHEVRVSDHRPVSGRFRIRVKTVDSRSRMQSKMALEKEFERISAKIGHAAKLDYLMNTLGLKRKEADGLLRS